MRTPWMVISIFLVGHSVTFAQPNQGRCDRCGTQGFRVQERTTTWLECLRTDQQFERKKEERTERKESGTGLPHSKGLGETNGTVDRLEKSTRQ